MDFDTMKELFSEEYILELIKSYQAFGPIPGILLPILEAFLPFLPLVVFVIANTNAFGLWLGFLLTWIGSTIGAILVFLLIRRFGHTKLLTFIQRHKQVKKLTKWLDVHGFGPLFLLMCFPFTPSAVVNIVAGLSHISRSKYIFAVLAGKLVMIFTISYVGHDIVSLFTNPGRTAIIAVIIFILWYVGKKIELSLNRDIESKVKARQRETQSDNE
ncbi:TVP38/TMEM64 family protein [Bacillus sp. AGMB 02131]|uniref:TVP38/TMEM64 family membrane protein n=1 Tax=Peribacillus faecalis TaxID=2772559 RepID=A0A927CYZ1_9BACI|nr:TVP38/TMEM64 family protein [Peribacillus faecalis]MBD3110282.1 TVP38/TMEM64 family protein [Peribacillus faecalis]